MKCDIYQRFEGPADLPVSHEGVISTMRCRLLRSPRRHHHARALARRWPLHRRSSRRCCCATTASRPWRERREAGGCIEARGPARQLRVRRSRRAQVLHTKNLKKGESAAWRVRSCTTVCSTAGATLAARPVSGELEADILVWVIARRAATKQSRIPHPFLRQPYVSNKEDCFACARTTAIAISTLIVVTALALTDQPVTCLDQSTRVE